MDRHMFGESESFRDYYLSRVYYLIARTGHDGLRLTGILGVLGWTNDAYLLDLLTELMTLTVIEKIEYRTRDRYGVTLDNRYRALPQAGSDWGFTFGEGKATEGRTGREVGAAYRLPMKHYYVRFRAIEQDGLPAYQPIAARRRRRRRAPAHV